MIADGVEDLDVVTKALVRKQILAVLAREGYAALGADGWLAAIDASSNGGVPVGISPRLEAPSGLSVPSSTVWS